MEHKLATAEKRVLVDLVKLVQKRELVGENGGWKDFLNVYDKKFGSSLSDPARRSNDVLIAFLMSFKKKEDMQLIARIMQCGANRDLIEKFKDDSSDKETPEQRLVRLTIAHYDYPNRYSFPSHSGDWFVTSVGKKKSKVVKSTRMLAIDCEMVTCEDGSEAVVRVGAVDRDLKVVLDKFVKPDKPVFNYKTDITGVTAEDLERATLSVTDIQKKLRRFLSVGTILVGHGLHNDLEVLRIDHARVIDTSFVFKYSNAPKEKRPSLDNLCKSVLDEELRMVGAAHNCVHDAAAAMKLVLAVVEKGVDTTLQLTPEMLEAEKTRKEAKQEAGKAQLLLHKIPPNVSSQELQGVLTGDFTLDVQPPKRLGGFYTAKVDFSSREEANQAFENVEAAILKDKGGLSQKEVAFKLSSGLTAKLFVRKMVHDEISAPKRARTEESDVSSKRQKRVDESSPKRARTEESDVSSKRQKRVDESEEIKEAVVNQREADKKKLLLHRIPLSVPSEELQGAISGNFTLEVMPQKRKGRYYNAVVSFKSPEEANQAFENVGGDEVKDNGGLAQKLVAFKLSSGSGIRLYVRKMVQDESEEAKEENVNHCEEDQVEVLKETVDAKEFEEVKLKLKAKEHEVRAQDKIIANLKLKLREKQSKC